MATIDDLLNDAAVVRDEDQEQENTAFRVGTLLVNVIQYLSSLITSEDANAAISDALADFFVEGALKQSALPPDFMSSLSNWAEGVAEKESTTHLLKLIHSRIILLDSMGSTLDGLDYTPVAGDLVWRTGYVWKYNGSEYEDGGIPPKSHAVYVNKHTSKMYMWNGRAMVEVGNHYDDKIQISKMDETAIANIPAGKVHYVPSQSKLVYRISRDEWHSWTPRTDLIYIDISSNTLYRWQGSSFQKVTSNSGSGGGAAGVSAFENYEAYESINALPGQGVATTGYIVGTHIYAYVNTGGDTMDGKYQDLGTLDAAGVSVTTSEDGTFTIHVGSDSYTVNLNHTHPNMCKLIVCEESDLPSTLDPATIYAQVDDADNPTEIEVLYIAGLEFVGGGGDDDTPKLTSPVGTSIDFNGSSTKTITVKGKNLTGALSLAVTGNFTVTSGGSSVSSISASDANAGVQLTLTKGSGFNSGTLAISSATSEFVAKSFNVDDSQALVDLLGVKLTGTQWLQTDYKPNANTEFVMKVHYDANTKTTDADNGKGCYILCCPADTANNKKFVLYNGAGGANNVACQLLFNNESSLNNQIINMASYTSEFYAAEATISYVKGSSNGTIKFNGGTERTHTTALKTTTMPEAMAIGYHQGAGLIYNVFDLTIFELTITEGGTTVRHYVPKKLNGVPGLYDTVNDTFISSETATELVEVPLT